MSASQKLQPKASALLSPRELQKYKEWRFPESNAVISGDDGSVLLPTAFEYADFLDWRTAQRMRQSVPPADSEDEDTDAFGKKIKNPEHEGFALADHCGHPLHPGYSGVLDEMEEGDLIPWCPMCTLRIHLQLLAELWDKWLRVGGPWRILPPGTTGDEFIIAKRAYYQRKVDFVNAMDGVEDIARMEVAWEVEHPATDFEAVKAFGATKAVEAYCKGISFPAQLAEAKQALPPRITPKKRLSYSSGTPEKTRNRPNAFYARRCTSYDPDSPHACPDKEGWAETSFKNDWEYNVRQCRLLYCDKDPSLPNVVYRELFDEKSKDHLVKGINSWFTIMDPRWIPAWQNNMLATTEIFLVWRDEKCPNGDDDRFNNWEKVETLVGTNLEAYARRIGDTDEEESAQQQVPPEIGLQSMQREDEDFFNQESLASDSSSEGENEDEEQEEDGLADPMKLEEDDNNTVGDHAGEEDGRGDVEGSASMKGH
jgi:hypothetical protein